MNPALWLLALSTACQEGPPPGAEVCEEPGNLCPIAGMGGLNGFNGDGLPALETLLYYPTSLIFDPGGALVLVDFNNMRIRRLEDGILTTIAGSGEHNWSVQGTPILESPLENPIDVAFLPDGTFFIINLHEQRVIYVGEESVVDVYAGTGKLGYSGDGGDALEAEMSQGCGLAVSDDGTLYISDTENHAVRAVYTDGLIETVAGCGEAGFSDGVAGCLDSPQRIVWSDGALYIADTHNHAIRRLEIESGVVTTLAGSGEQGYGGDGGPATEAQLNNPIGVDIAPDGTLYIADGENHVIRRVSPEGVISTVAGTGHGGFVAEGGPALTVSINYPGDVLVSPEGDLYVADMLNGAVQRLKGPIP